MNQESELGRLERFVEKMMVRFTELRAENSQLSRDLQERNALVEKLRGNLSTRESERGEISQRVSRIVEQIEEWERSFDGVQETGGIENTNDQMSVESDGVASEEEDEKLVQHNLFSMTDADR